MTNQIVVCDQIITRDMGALRVFVTKVAVPSGPAEAPEDVALAKVPEAPNEANHRQAKSRVEDEPKVSVLLLHQPVLVRRQARRRETIQVLDTDRQRSVGKHPKSHETSTEGLVRVVHSRLFRHLLYLDLLKGTSDRLFERSVDIGLWGGLVFDDGGLGIFGLGRGNGWKSIDLVTSFGTPRNLDRFMSGGLSRQRKTVRRANYRRHRH